MADADLLATTGQTLADLIGFPTVSEDSNLALIDYVAERLESAGARVKTYPDAEGGKANLFATIGPDSDDGIVLSGHTDVVPVTAQEWSSDPFVLREHEGLLFGRGSCDMKGFIAATLAIAPQLAASGLKRPVHFAFTHDEEVGCLGAQDLVAALKREGVSASAAIIGEPTGMHIIEGHKGCHEYTTRFHGTAGHGSRPDLGVNAVEYAVRYVHRMMELAENLKSRVPAGSRFEPPWTTLQVGTMQGGIARNVIAQNCAVEWEMRPVSAGDAHMVKRELRRYCEEELLPQMRAISPEAAIEIETIGEIAGLVPMDENAARALVAELTGTNSAELVAFGTEAGLFQEMGMSVVVCGPGSIEQAHKPDEFVSLAQLDACLDMLTGLQAKLAA